MGDRTNHPLWGRLITEVEALFGCDPLTQLKRRMVYVAIDPAIDVPQQHRLAGEWTVEFDHRPSSSPNNISTRTLRDRLRADVRLLFTGPRNVDVQLLGEIDVDADA
jgi:hypothetical protein